MHRRARESAHVVLLALVVASACSRGDAPAADSAKAAVARVAAPAPNVMPGALVKPVDEYSGDEFYAFVQKQQYVGAHEKERLCRDKPGCVTTVLVDAIVTQDSLSAETTPQYGVVYIHGVNKGAAVESRYGLKPGPQYQYYWIISTDSTQKSMQWRLEELDTDPTGRRHVSVGTGPFVGCNHPWTPGARADFKTCATAAALHDSVQHLGVMLQGGIGDPIWSECAQGCCVDGVDGFPGPLDTGTAGVRGRGRGTGRPPR